MKKIFYELSCMIKELPLHLSLLLGQILPATTLGCKIRGLLYYPYLKKCGRNFQISIGARIENPCNIQVGDNVYIGPFTRIDGLRGGITLEDEVMIGPYVSIVSSNHTFENGSARFAPGVGGYIHIGKGTWIASHVMVTAGVIVGSSCLLAAGAVVCKDVPAGMMVGGVPATEIKKIY